MPGQFSGLAVADQTVYVSSNFVNTTDYSDAQYSGGYVYDGGLLALDTFSGIKIWEYPIQGSVESPILGNNMVYAVSDNGKVYALTTMDGTEIWKRATGTNLGHGILSNGSLYVGTTKGVDCFNALNGNVIWNFVTDEYAGSSATLPLYSDEVVYVGWNGPQFFSSVTQHEFYALSALTGEKIGNYALGYTVQSSPTIVDSTIYIGASWVTEESPDYTGPGALIALNSTVAFSPQNSSSASAFVVVLSASVIVAVVSLGLIIYFKRHKH
jgi:outer membrane protein assembly factor BamB